jgi:hypothetical protein
MKQWFGAPDDLAGFVLNQSLREQGCKTPESQDS